MTFTEIINVFNIDTPLTYNKLAFYQKALRTMTIKALISTILWIAFLALWLHSNLIQNLGGQVWFVITCFVIWGHIQYDITLFCLDFTSEIGTKDQCLQLKNLAEQHPKIRNYFRSVSKQGRKITMQEFAFLKDYARELDNNFACQELHSI